MSRYISCAASLFDDFERYRITSGTWSGGSEKRLQSFDRYCLNGWPDTKELSQDMVDGWFKNRPTETPASCAMRVSIVTSWIKYLHERNIHTEIRIPEAPHSNKCQYIPHAFTEEELGEFLRACDNIPIKRKNDIGLRLRKLQLPVIFRLMVSSGLRTVEARMLRVEDVNLDDGIISIRKTKGRNQHFVVLDDYMLEILRRYDKAISRPSLCSDREYFFPSSKGTPHDVQWLSRNFKKLWNESYGRAVPHDLRHYYATFNINSWIGFGLEFNARFLYLSKSMGHSSVEITKYYYNLVPALADVMLELTNDSFNEIIPDVNYEDE